MKAILREKVLSRDAMQVMWAGLLTWITASAMLWTALGSMGWEDASFVLHSVRIVSLAFGFAAGCGVVLMLASLQVVRRPEGLAPTLWGIATYALPVLAGLVAQALVGSEMALFETALTAGPFLLLLFYATTWVGPARLAGFAANALRSLQRSLGLSRKAAAQIP